MTEQNFPFETTDEINKRQKLLNKLILTILDEDERPYFVSDRATLYDITIKNEDEIINLISEKYGVLIQKEHFQIPIWKLLDFLSCNVGNGESGPHPGS